MDVLTYPNKFLLIDLTDPDFSISKDELNDDHLQRLIDGMINEMYTRKGLGLAANQIGRAKPIFVVDIDGDPLVAINPTVHGLLNKAEMDEACMSLPGISTKVPRYKYIRLIYMTPEGDIRSDFFEGVQAQAVQHEMDHLAGRLYWDNLSSMKRDLLKKRYKKIHKYD